MEVFVRLAKAVGIVLALFTVSAALALLVAWMKGLLLLLIIYGWLVYVIYNKLERRERLKDRHGGFRPWK